MLRMQYMIQHKTQDCNFRLYFKVIIKQMNHILHSQDVLSFPNLFFALRFSVCLHSFQIFENVLC